jgi:hypothetical protein
MLQPWQLGHPVHGKPGMDDRRQRGWDRFKRRAAAIRIGKPNHPAAERGIGRAGYDRRADLLNGRANRRATAGVACHEGVRYFIEPLRLDRIDDRPANGLDEIEVREYAGNRRNR